MARPRSQPPQGPNKRARRTADDFGDPWIKRGSAEDKAGRGREKDESDERGNFERRAEWFRLLHSDPSGWTSDEHVRRAVEHAVRLEQELPQLRLEPRDVAPKPGAALVAGAERRRARVRAAKNPRPRSSLGFVGEPVEIRFEAEAFREGFDVAIGLDPKVAKQVDLSSLRVFRFDEETEAWVLVRRSGVARDLSYAWVRAHRPGTYGVVGLPADPTLMLGVLLLGALQPQLEVARRTRSLEKLVDAVANLLFAGGEIKTLANELPGGFELSGLDLPPGGLDADAFRRRFAKLDLPERGLPEWDLLDDICPPTWRKPGYGWPWPPISWPPKIYWPPVIWPLLPSDWTSCGPRNVNGRVKSLAIHPVTENVLWAGAANGGVWKSVNGGASWLPMMSQELSLAIGAIAVSPSDPFIVYAATGEDTPNASPSWGGAGVYKTDTAGGSWTLCASIGSTRCTRVLVHPANPDIVYVAGNMGLHKTTDGGATWTTVLTGHVSDAVMDPHNPWRLFAGVWNSGVFRTTNGGASWTQLSSGVPTGTAADWIKLAIGRYGGVGSDLVLAKMGADSGSIFRTTDGGTSWGLVASNVQGVSYNEWTNSIAVDPYNQQRILAGGAGLSRSTNGTAFTVVAGTHSDHHAIVYSPEDSNTVFMSTDGGVYRSTDGGATWGLRSYDLIATQMYSIGVSQTTPFCLGGATQDQGIIRTTGAADWISTGAGNEGGFYVVDPNNAANVYASPWAEGLRRSTDGGANWSTIHSGLDDPGYAHDLAVQPGNSSLLLAAVGTRVFQSTNQGNSWLPVLTTSEVIARITFSNSSPSICYMATWSGTVFKSDDAGAGFSWNFPYTFANMPPRGNIAAVAVSHTNADRVYLGYAGFGVAHVLRSDDGGAHWINASGTGTATLPDIPVSALAVNHLNSDVVYAATDIGVFRTTDGGATWESFNEGMPRTVVTGVALRRSSRMLYASTMGRGAYRRRVWFG